MGWKTQWTPRDSEGAVIQKRQEITYVPVGQKELGSRIQLEKLALEWRRKETTQRQERKKMEMKEDKDTLKTKKEGSGERK